MVVNKQLINSLHGTHEGNIQALANIINTLAHKIVGEVKGHACGSDPWVPLAQMVLPEVLRKWVSV